jgi:hypothetical protein
VGGKQNFEDDLTHEESRDALDIIMKRPKILLLWIAQRYLVLTTMWMDPICMKLKQEKSERAAKFWSS